MGRFLGTLQEYPPTNIGSELPQMIATLLNTTAQLRAQKKERDLRAGVLNLISKRANERDIAGFMAQQNQPSYAPGALGFMHRIIDTATGGNVTTPFEQGIMGVLSRNAFRDPLEQEYLSARIEATKALADKRGAGSERASNNIIADISRTTTALTKAEKLGDEGLSANLQRELDNLHNELIDVRQRDFPEVVGPEYEELFDKAMEKQPKERRTWYDRVYGQKAYRQARGAYMRLAAKEYKTPPSKATQQFDKIWLKRYQAEESERFRKYGQLPTKQVQSKEVVEKKKVTMKAPDGKTYTVDESEVEEAKKHGWKVL